MEVLILTSSSSEEFKSKLHSYTKSLEFKEGELPQIKRLALIIDGPTLTFAVEDEQTKLAFFRLGLTAASVVCCRVSPKQKADVCGIAKSQGPWITLAIGDGANDVPMILEAHIGVGVRGKEGTQAVRSGDYAISQFQYLEKLLLVHGRWGYRRVSLMICYYFYKNIILVFTEFYFAFFNGFSGQIYFADWLPMLYNAVWTSWHCLFAYLYEQVIIQLYIVCFQDIGPQFSYKYPIVYEAGQRSEFFSYKVFWKWLILAFYHGAVTFYGVQFVRKS